MAKQEANIKAIKHSVSEQLAEIKHMVRVPPWLFKETLNNAVADELNRKLANKVVLDVGLCISLFDILSLEDSYIFPGDGASHNRITFRFVVFRPFLDEILEGTIKASNSEGIQVTLGFFEDIYIRKDVMLSNSHFDETDQTWIWDYEGDETTHQMFMDIGERIRFKVIEEQFNDTTPTHPSAATATPAPTAPPAPPTETAKDKTLAPFVIYGAINDHGLGLVSWWITPEAAENEEEEEEAEPEADMNNSSGS